MRLTELELYNWCQHRSRRLEFHPGLTAIIGPNGSGKSNLLGGIRWLLTGQNPNAGTKDENISQYAGSDENAYGVLRFGHGDINATVTRYLRPETRKSLLHVTTGDRTLSRIHGDTKINAEIQQILGVDFDTINEIALVAQEDIFGFLAKVASKRAAAFQKLFHTEDATAVYDALGKHLSRLSIPAVATDLDALREEYSIGVRTHGRLAGESVQLPSASELRAAQLVDQQAIDDFARYNEMTVRLTQLREQRGHQVTDQYVTAVRVTGAETDVATLTDAMNNSLAPCEEAKRLLHDLDRYAAVERSADEMRRRIAGLEGRLTEMLPPTRPANYCDDVPTLEARLGVLQQKILRDEQMVRDLLHTGRTECPTCHTRVEGGLRDEVQRAERELPADKAERETLMAQDHATRIYAAALVGYESSRGFIEEALRLTRENLATLVNVTPPQIAEEALTARVEQHESFAYALNEYRNLLAQARLAACVAVTQLQNTDHTITELERQLAALSITAGHAEAAQRRTAERAGQLARRERLDIELAAQTAIVERMSAELGRLEAQAREAATLRNWCAGVQAWRNIVHWENLPTWVIRRNLQRLGAITNETLSMFQTDFRVEADNELSFRARFLDGREQPAERLSHGQKVVLALAVRLALNLRVAPELGLLALDEPTAWLDAHHIRGLTPVLERLHTFAASRSLQCVIITHENALAPLFDRVIEL